MADGRFVLVFHEDMIANHGPVWDDDKTLATWLRLLALADRLWPSPAELPRGVSRAAVDRLVGSGLIEMIGRNRYHFPSLDKRRTAQSNAASNAARIRHGTAQSNASALPDPMPTKTQTNTRPEQDIDKAPTAEAIAKPRASGPKNEPRLTEAQLKSWANFGPRWDRFKEAWLARGLYFAPFGSPDDDDTSQRGLLFQVLDARPTDIVRWVREAPTPSAREVITYILEQWHSVREAAGVDDDEWDELKREERRKASGSMTRIGALVKPDAA